jgi:hypothetical protein
MTIEIIANCLTFIYFVKNRTKKKFQLVRHYKNEFTVHNAPDEKNLATKVQFLISVEEEL